MSVGESAAAERGRSGRRTRAGCCDSGRGPAPRVPCLPSAHPFARDPQALSGLSCQNSLSAGRAWGGPPDPDPLLTAIPVCFLQSFRNLSSALGCMSPATSSQILARKRRRGVSLFTVLLKKKKLTERATSSLWDLQP